MGVVFQSFHLIPTMTALENVATPLELAGAQDALDRARAELEAVGLSHRADHYPSQMSGGEQQRVALARTMATDPRLILADEPTGQLDSRTGAAITELIASLVNDAGIAAIVATHDAGPRAVAHRDAAAAGRSGLDQLCEQLGQAEAVERLFRDDPREMGPLRG